MKVNKLFAISLIVALVVAALPLSGVFAAGSGGGGTNNNNNNTGTISQSQIRNLQAEASSLNNVRTRSGQGLTMRGKNQQYFARLQFALAQAEAIVAGRLNLSAGNANNGTSSNGTSTSCTSSNGTSSTGTSTSGTSTSGTSATGSVTGNNGFVIGKYYQKHPDKLLAMYLHVIRQLRAKLGMGQANSNACLATSTNGSNNGSTGGSNSGSTNGTSNGSNNGSNSVLDSCQSSTTSNGVNGGTTSDTGTTNP